MKNKWSLDELQIFRTVVQSGSFSAAARQLNCSNAFVSKKIADLEAAMAVQLFRRTTRVVQITSEGELAYEWAVKLLATVDDMNREIAGTRDTPSGRLRVATSLRMGRHHVSPLLSALAQRWPELDVWLELVDRRLDLLAEGFDLDIRVGEVTDPHLIATRVMPSVRLLCAAPAYLQRAGRPQRLADLHQHQCLPFRDRDQSFGCWRLTGPEGEETIKVMGQIGSNHADIVKNWTLEGRGITLLSWWDMARQVHDGELEVVLPNWYQRADIWAVTPARLDSSSRMQVCVADIVSQLQQGPWALPPLPDWINLR